MQISGSLESRPRSISTRPSIAWPAVTVRDSAICSCETDPRPFQAQLAQQRAARAKDEALLQGSLLDLKRYEDLVRRDFASHQQVDQQRAQVDRYRAQIDSDQAQIDYAQTQLGYTTIRSPIEGRAGIRQIDAVAQVGDVELGIRQVQRCPCHQCR
jgi:multidrug efflux pump subunit AcrA (membrane-fusion protein)